jgi:hypothetical protein
MPDANSGMGSHRQGQQREEQPRQPGAHGRDEEAGAEEAKEQAIHRRGKTGKHTSDDRG